MKCNYCNVDIADTAIICINCGHKIENDNETETTAKNKAANTSANNLSGKPRPAASIAWTHVATAVQDNIITNSVIIAVLLINVIIVVFIKTLISKKQDENLLSNISNNVVETVDNVSEEAITEIVNIEDSMDSVDQYELVDLNENQSTLIEDSAQTDTIDVESSVLQIRNQYNEIVNGISFNLYDVIEVYSGITAYVAQNQIKAIIIKKDYDGYNYTRSFYYNGNKLFFAYYEGSDSHRFYFDAEQLIRWRYCPDAVDISKATNHDMERTADYIQWEQRVKDDAYNLENELRSVINTTNNVP